MSAIDALRRALEHVYSGAGFDEAEAVLDKLSDEGYRVTAAVRQDGPSLFDEVDR